jgi:hypothetical protein
MSEISVSTLRKEGKLKQAYSLASDRLDSKPGYIPYVEDIMWVYYEYAKQAVINSRPDNMIRIMSKICNLNYANNQMFNESFNWQLIKLFNNKNLQKSKTSNLIDLIKTCNTFVRNQQASVSKSVLLKSILRLLKNNDNAWSMLDYLDKKHFRKEDFQSEIYNNAKMMPLFEQFLYAYSKSWLTSIKDGKSNALTKKDSLLSILREFENNKQYRFVLYYKAKVNLIADKNSAYTDTQSFLKTSISQSYAWTLLSECSSNTEHQISYLSRAILLQKDEKFTLGARQTLFNIYLKQNNTIMVNYLVYSIINIRQRNKWAISNALSQWQTIELGDDDIRQAQENIKRNANSAIFNCFVNAISYKAIVTAIVPNKRMFYAVDTNGATHRFKQKLKLDIGEFVEIIIDKKILEIKPIPQPYSITGSIRRFEGKFKSIKDFGFVKDIFITPKLAQNINTVSKYYGYAIEELNKKTNKMSWRAVCLKKSSL